MEYLNDLFVEVLYLNIDFKSQRSSSGWSSGIPGNDDQRVRLDLLPVELAFDDEIETRVDDVVRNVEDVADIAGLDAVVPGPELAEILE